MNWTADNIVYIGDGRLTRWYMDLPGGLGRVCVELHDNCLVRRWRCPKGWGFTGLPMFSKRVALKAKNADDAKQEALVKIKRRLQGIVKLLEVA